MQPHLLHTIAAAAGTPCYVYSQERIEENYRTLRDAFKQANHGRAVALHYAIKANSNLEILKLLRDLGAGFDVVSGGELAAVLKIGAHPEHIVFAGVGKRDEELAAAVGHKIA